MPWLNSVAGLAAFRSDPLSESWGKLDDAASGWISAVPVPLITALSAYVARWDAYPVEILAVTLLLAVSIEAASSAFAAAMNTRAVAR